ncbi:MAG: dihydrodipicolinate synthase family protein [Capsulimonadales bacterium]|nr:dihydrodipicolinate synthase family protein [Capsulimonadales bacterium]
MPNTPWRDVFPAVTTQMKQDQSLDPEATARHLDVLIESGVSGLIMLGSLGENVTLDPEEKETVLRTAMDVAGGRVPVLSGVAECSTAAAVRFARRVEDLGVDGIMLLPPMVYRADPRETIAHFRAVAGATDLPIIVYNNPLAYHADITPEMFDELSDEMNLVAIKESSGNVRRITDIINRVGDRYRIFTGVDDLVLESVLLGAEGWIAGVGLAFPKENQYLWDLMMAGRWDEARTLYRWFTPLLHLDTPIKFVQYIKLMIQECGLGAEWVRAPRLPIEGDEREAVLSVIRQGIATRPEIPERTAP